MTKIRALFDASAKSLTGVSLNDTLLVGPTAHPLLVDVLLCFWRKSLKDPILEYQMTHVIFGVSASSFILNMAIKQNADDHANEYPLAAKVVHESFYVDDSLTGADTIEDAQKLKQQLQDLFACGGFLLHNWNCSEPFVIEHLPPNLWELNIGWDDTVL